MIKRGRRWSIDLSFIEISVDRIACYPSGLTELFVNHKLGTYLALTPFDETMHSANMHLVKIRFGDWKQSNLLPSPP